MLKVFHFDRTHGFLTSAEMIDDQRPDIGLPAFCTDIPPDFEVLGDGEIPVFDGTCWRAAPDTFYHPIFKETSYNSGRSSECYRPLALSMYSKHFPSYPAIPSISNPFLITQAIIQRVRLLQSKYENAIRLYARCMSDEGIAVDSPRFERLAARPSLLHEFKFELESMVYLMRRVLDSLVQLGYLQTNWGDFESSLCIECSELGDLLRDGSKFSQLKKVVLGDGEEYKADDTGFLTTINNLFNSFKHSLMHEESHSMIGVDFPTVVSYQAKNNKFRNEIVVHNHDLTQLMIGFQNSIERILLNQRSFAAQA